MKTILFIILSFLATYSTDTILWDSSNELEWEDFQGTPPNNRGVKMAVSSVKIVVESNEYYEGDIPSFSVKSYFNKKKSWTVTNSKKSLLHERLHFDITEVYSRRIRCQLKALEKAKEIDVNRYKETYRKLLKEHGEVQKKYDSEVYFNKDKQQEWIDSITKQLEELKEFEYSSEE